MNPLDNTQPSLNSPPHPPPLPLYCLDIRRSCTAGAARSVTGAGGKAASLTGYLCSAPACRSAPDDGYRAHGKTQQKYLRNDLIRRLWSRGYEQAPVVHIAWCTRDDRRSVL